MRPLLTLLLLLLLQSGCSWFGAGEQERYLLEGSSKPVVIPANLDEPDFVDLMPIPEIDDYRGLGDVDLEVGLPDPLSTEYGVDKIVIRRLGDNRWVFADSSTSIIWPQVVSYWEENNLPVASLDPRNGVLETAWLPATGDDAESIFSSIREGAVLDDTAPGSQHKFRVRVEPGVRDGSTEVYVDHKVLPTGAPFRLDEVDWSGGSDNSELEGEVLKAVAYYLGEHVAEEPSVSMLAAAMQEESKATLEARPGGAVLRYRLNFDRAWATVGAALENAKVNVEDLDRTAANYYVQYTSKHNPKPGFFSKIFTGGDGDEAGGNRFTIHLESVDEEVHVTVARGTASGRASEDESEGAPEDVSGDESEAAPKDAQTLLLTERLLKLIREYST